MPSSNQLAKLGNTLIFLSNHVSELSKTKILKLLFLIEEKSILEHGFPFFGFKFEVWQFGPVLKEVFVDLSGDTNNFTNNYIQKTEYDPTLYEAVKEFDDDEFSDWDIEILEKIASFAKNKTAKDFVAITHSEHSLWTKTAKKYGVFEDLENRKISSTDFAIDFSLLFEHNEEFRERYVAAIENDNAISSLKN